MKTVTIVNWEGDLTAFEYPEDARNFACNLWRENYSEVLADIAEEDGIPFEEALNNAVIDSEENPDQNIIAIRELVIN